MARGSSSVLGLQGIAAMAVAVATLLVAAAAPRCAAQASSGCTMSIISLAPCLSFTAGNTSTPSPSCCSALASVVKGAQRCLCAVLNGGAGSFGVTVNATRALELPAKCNVQTPPASECNAVGAPAASAPPAVTPGAGSASPSAPAATAQAPTAPPPVYNATGARSKATPATGAVSSHAGITKSAAVSVSFVVAIASLIAF